MKLKENGDKPMNARINIKYTENKPKVSFSYPDEKTQIKGSMFIYIIYMWLFFLMFLLVAGGIYGRITGTNLSAPDSFPQGILYLIVLGPPILIYLPFKNKWDKLYPKFQGMIASKKLMVFHSKDVQQDGRFFCEIPLFSNIVLDFKTKGDFSEYLEEVDIQEYKFFTFKVGFRTKRKRKKKVNEFLWYARFYFNKKPQKGKLEVIFK
jgi:hypothetical protein